MKSPFGMNLELVVSISYKNTGISDILGLFDGVLRSFTIVRRPVGNRLWLSHSLLIASVGNR